MRRPSGPFGQHPLDGEFDRALRMFLEQLAQRDALQVPDIPRVLVIELVGELGTGDAYRARIDDHDVIAEILMRRIIGLVLALQTMRDLGRQTPESLAGRID